MWETASMSVKLKVGKAAQWAALAPPISAKKCFSKQNITHPRLQACPPALLLAKTKTAQIKAK
jgi:hypothetical protein